MTKILDTLVDRLVTVEPDPGGGWNVCIDKVVVGNITTGARADQAATLARAHLRRGLRDAMVAIGERSRR